jgi:hypothetical protein
LIPHRTTRGTRCESGIKNRYNRWNTWPWICGGCGHRNKLSSEQCARQVRHVQTLESRFAELDQKHNKPRLRQAGELLEYLPPSCSNFFACGRLHLFFTTTSIVALQLLWLGHLLYKLLLTSGSVGRGWLGITVLPPS